MTEKKNYLGNTAMLTTLATVGILVAPKAKVETVASAPEAEKITQSESVSMAVLTPKQYAAIVTLSAIPTKADGSFDATATRQMLKDTQAVEQVQLTCDFLNDTRERGWSDSRFDAYIHDMAIVNKEAPELKEVFKDVLKKASEKETPDSPKDRNTKLNLDLIYMFGALAVMGGVGVAKALKFPTSQFTVGDILSETMSGKSGAITSALIGVGIGCLVFDLMGSPKADMENHLMRAYRELHQSCLQEVWKEQSKAPIIHHVTVNEMRQYLQSQKKNTRE